MLYLHRKYKTKGQFLELVKIHNEINKLNTKKEQH